MAISALEVYRFGGKFYSTVVEDNGGPFLLGKQLVDGVPSDPGGFQGDYHYNNPYPQLFPAELEIQRGSV